MVQLLMMETNEPNFRGNFRTECRGRYSESIKSVADFFIPNFVGSKQYFTVDLTRKYHCYTTAITVLRKIAFERT